MYQAERAYLRHSAPSGFTLIELLVVVSIIALLIALLLPSLGKAKEAARAAACMANERQIGITMSNYVGDWKGTYPYGRPAKPGQINVYDDSNIPRWYLAISPYLGNYTRQHKPKVLFCPSNPWPATDFGSPSKNGPPSTYGLGPTFPRNWHNQTNMPGAENMVPPRRDHELKRPGNTLMAGETPHGATADGAPENLRSESVQYEAFWPFAPYESNWRSEEICGGGTPTMVIHDVSWNSLMADGHVVRTRKSRLAELAWHIQLGGTPLEGDLFWMNW